MNKRVLRHPGRWIWLPLLVPIAIGLGRLHFDAEVFDLLPPDLPVVEGLKLYEHHFAGARDLMITLKGTEPERVEAAAREIAARLRPMTNLAVSASWEAPWLEHPEQVAELMAYLWFNQPPEVFRSLQHRFAPDQLAETFAAARDELATALSPEQIARLSYDPLGLTSLPESVAGAAPSFGQGRSLFSSADGTFRVVFVRASSELRTYRDCDQWLASIKPAVQAAVDSSERRPASGIDVAYTGRPAFVSEIAASMGHDIIASVGGTSAVIAVLFWLAHRRIKPMLWLLALLALVLGATLALGGMIYGTINVISMGFAAILLGLAVDYAVVHYQEALVHEELSVPEIRRAIAPSIFWAATTTICAFLVLNLGGLPGLGQLGTLVGLGVALAACIMIFEYLPPLFPDRCEPRANLDTINEKAVAVPALRPWLSSVSFLLSGAVLLFSGLVLLIMGAPQVDSSADALRPQNSPAYAALDQMQKELSQTGQPLWLIVEGRTVAEVANRLEQIQSVLKAAVSNQTITSYTMPTELWPRPRFQEANRAVALQMGSQGERLLAEGRTNGFAPQSLALAEGMLAIWRQAGASSGAFWPGNPLSQWIIDKVVARTPTNYLALGLLNAGGKGADLSALAAELNRMDGHLSGWEILGHAIYFRVKDNMWKVVSPMIALVLLSLWLAFGRFSEVLLGLAVLALSGLCLLAVMRLAGWSWNLLNLMAVPLVLGTGVDYGLFTQLALRRHHGDLALAYRSVGRALLLCGGTAIAAFASLGLSSNAGMASLGQVCAVGIACNMLIAVYLLPVWWQWLAGTKSST